MDKNIYWAYVVLMGPEELCEWCSNYSPSSAIEFIAHTRGHFNSCAITNNNLAAFLEKYQVE